MGVKIGVVLPAAGTGQRIGSPVPKQLLLLDGCRLIIRTIQSFFEWCVSRLLLPMSHFEYLFVGMLIS